MGFDPLSIDYIRIAHERGLGCGDPREIEIVGDEDPRRASAGTSSGPIENMTFASRMQHLIYWGPLKKPIEWSLKTVLAPWAYLASVAYHDSLWYPLVAKRRMKEVLASDWGRLFASWENLTPDERGFPDLGDVTPELQRTGFAAFATSLGRARDLHARGARNSPRASATGSSGAGRTRSALLVDLLGEVALLADLADDVQLALEPVGAVLLAHQDLLEQLARAVVALLDAQRDALVEPLDGVLLEREIELVLLDRILADRTGFRRCMLGTPSR